MNGDLDNDALEERLLPDRITVRKPVQSMADGTKRPVFDYEAVATGVRARFNPDRTSLEHTVMGQSPKKRYQLFLNVMDLVENYEIVNETTGEIFVVTEVRNFFNHHLEVLLEEKR